MSIRLIACIDKNHGLGMKNKLLYNIKADMGRFKKLTTGHAVVMGRKTFESLPNGPLKDRANFVISKTSGMIDGAILYRSVTDFIIGGLKHPEVKDRKIFIIGGGEIYGQFIDHANHIEITHVDSEKKADSFFPNISPDVWEVENESEEFIENNVPYRHVTYKRKIQL